MNEEQTQTTLRDTITEAFEQVEQKTESPVQTEQKAEPAKSDRARDDQGRFTEYQKVDQKADKPIDVSRPQRPSTWKKDYWDHWEKLDPGLANYLVEREQQFAKGVSTYKTEADKAKEIFEAIAPFQNYINIRGGNVKEVITNLLQTADAFNKNDPQTRLQALMQIANQFQIPLAQAFQQDPQIGGYIQQMANELNGLKSQWKSFQDAQQQAEYSQLNGEVQAFASDPNHQHFEQVRETMAGLLQAGLADDLKSAYEAAIRMPKHSDIFTQVQQQQLAADEAKKKEAQAKEAASARAKVTSTKSSTPAGNAKAAGSKGIRAALESAFEEHDGRV